MLHDVGHVHLIARDTGRLECLVEQSSRRSDKRLPGKIFSVARLFPNEHHNRISSAFTEDRLRSTTIEFAAPAVSGCLSRCAKRGL
jgi:hypothetical protein